MTKENFFITITHKKGRRDNKGNIHFELLCVRQMTELNIYFLHVHPFSFLGNRWVVYFMTFHLWLRKLRKTLRTKSDYNFFSLYYRQSKRNEAESEFFRALIRVGLFLDLRKLENDWNISWNLLGESFALKKPISEQKFYFLGTLWGYFFFSIDKKLSFNLNLLHLIYFHYL